MQLGADDYITKPLAFMLLRVINTRLAKYDIEQINNEKFHALINHPLGIYIYQNGKLFYNNTLANIFGYDYDDFL
jgi:hypothetical protein